MEVGLSGFWQNVVCEMDCLDALQLIQLESSPSTVEHELVCKIKDILIRNWSVELSIIQQSANTVADYMARCAFSSQHEYKEWLSPSVDILARVQHDIAT
ncbi:hypothetical protein PIB30_017483 [Stylosanthes scabra]|uniref:RNase H type-1 domain-containing protein n=1 Tax=Stylosanthes scabra TaxID=79078 RepID=A0ABU6Z800_9FABA|nr:hypothetical protein [Stylosanthes scabra]